MDALNTFCEVLFLSPGQTSMFDVSYGGLEMSVRPQ